jgi:hypothetical protein
MQILNPEVKHMKKWLWGALCILVFLGLVAVAYHADVRNRIKSARFNQQLRAELAAKLAGIWTVVEKIPTNSVAGHEKSDYEIVIDQHGIRKTLSVYYYQRNPWKTIVIGDHITFTVPPNCTEDSNAIPKRL